MVLIRKGLVLTAFASLTFSTITTAAPTANVDLVPRFDYERNGGDILNRTMCFCTNTPSAQQSDADPEAFYNTTLGHAMGNVYQFEYYNHRSLTPASPLSLKKRVRVLGNQTCLTHDSVNDPYYHNDCLRWETQKHDYCADFHLNQLPKGVKNKASWEFCYLFRGDELDNPEKRDFFTFDGGKRAIPRVRDFVAENEVVVDKCRPLCEK
ncbi:MAG: hypothetical protein Q9201_006930, partial [Fulgogasparrea decipioides]